MYILLQDYSDKKIVEFYIEKLHPSTLEYCIP